MEKTSGSLAVAFIMGTAYSKYSLDVCLVASGGGNLLGRNLYAISRALGAVRPGPSSKAPSQEQAPSAGWSRRPGLGHQ